MKTCPIIILCILALFCILVLAMLLFFFYKNGERIARRDIEFARLEKEREESRLKLREMYRGKYLDTLKSESHQKYMEMLEKLSEIK